MIPHDELTVRCFGDQHGPDGATLDGAARAALLTEFRRTGAMLGAVFGRTHEEHEDAADPTTWGPASAADVDWTGFAEGGAR